MDERVRTQSILLESDSRHAFLMALDAALRPLDDPGEIQAMACSILGEHLGVTRVTVFDLRDGHYVVEQEFNHAVPSIAGRLPVTLFGKAAEQAIRRGRIAVNTDVVHNWQLTPAEKAAYASVQVGAYIVVPVTKNGRFVVGLSVQSRRPRAWSMEEIALAEETAERIWSAVVRARAEAAPVQSEARYRTLFTHIDEAFCVAELLYDEQGRPCDRRLIEANARYHELVGAQFTVGSTTRMLLPNVDNYWFERCHEAITTGESLRFEHYVAHLERWYNVYLSGIGPPERRTYAAVFHETTQRRQREANLEFLAEIGRDLVAINDTHGVVQRLGARIGAHLLVDGCALAAIDEASGRILIEHEWCREGAPGLQGQCHMAELIDPVLCASLRTGREVAVDDLLAQPEAVSGRMDAAGVRAFACVPVVVERQWRFALVTWQRRPRKWRHDETDLLRELTVRVWSRLELARAEEALRRHEEQLQRSTELLNVIIDRSPTGFYIVDADLRITHMNADSQARAFRNVNPAIGRRFDEAIRVIWPEPLAAELVARFRHTLETGEPYECQGMVAQRADLAQVECYDWQLQRITMPDGRHAVVCYYYDTTRLRQVENELREADRRKDEFLATLGHELRNPLAPVRNGLHYFRRLRGSSPEADAIFQMMDRQFTHLVRLVDDLLEVSRITRGKVELRLEKLHIAEVLRCALETSRPLVEECGQYIEINTGPPSLVVQADAVRLTQVFANLLNNAAKYTPRGGTITVQARREGNHAVVVVRDNGIGIPAAMLERIFDLFTQVGESGHRAQGGLGIGLTLVRRIIDMHGGSVAARSDGPGCGSEFIVTLPLLAQD